MADEKRKIKIIPESYPHDIGEVEITIYEQEIKDFGFTTAYKNTLARMLQCVKNNGFDMAILIHKGEYDYTKIKKISFLWLSKNNKELDYDTMNKDLTLWFSESLENKIKELSTIESETETLLGLVFKDFPLFKKHINKLEYSDKNIKPYITRVLGGLKWNYTNETLAWFFAEIKSDKSKNTNWENIENLFHVKNLKQSFQNHNRKKDEIQALKGFLNL